MKKYAPSLLLLLLCAVLPRTMLSTPPSLSEALLFHFTHANVFHFAVNALFLVSFKPRWTTALAAFFIASAAAYLPFTGMSAPTCGISGICFAMIARRDVAWRVLNWNLLLLNIPTIFLPMFNWKLHLASYILSFILWKIIYLRRKK